MSEQQLPRVHHNYVRPPRAQRLATIASMCTLLLGASACGSDSKQAIATSVTLAPAVAATEAPTTTTTTLAATTTSEPASTTTEPATTTTAATGTMTLLRMRPL